MGKLEEQTRRKKYSKKHNKRFYTKLDMAIVKHDQAVRNSKINRGEIEKKGNEYVSVCGCGREGCFIISGGDSVDKEYMDEWHRTQLQTKYQKGNQDGEG